MLNALVADYEGLDQMMLNYTFKGLATDLGTVSGGTFREDAQDLGINESNGWNLKRQRGVYEALSFIERWSIRRRTGTVTTRSTTRIRI